MENIVTIPTAANARESVRRQADIKCEKIWDSILCSVKSVICDAIEDCKYHACLSESAMRGVPTMAVFEKLYPVLTGMGYRVEMGKYAGIYISWEEGGCDGSI